MRTSQQVSVHHMPEAFRPRTFLLAEVRLFRDGLIRALQDSPYLEIVGSAGVREDVLELLTAAQPQVVLLEATHAREPVIVHSLLRSVPDVRVVAFAVVDEEEDAIRCAEAGAAGYVSHEASIDELGETVSRVARGEFPCSPRVATLLLQRLSSLASERAPVKTAAALTRRQREILRLIDAGYSNKEIAGRLGIEVSTVKNHVHQILDRTKATRRSQAAAMVRTQWPV